MDMIDLGIAKKHFEIEARGKFEFGNGGVTLFSMDKVHDSYEK
jgi:hypothetical protein